MRLSEFLLLALAIILVMIALFSPPVSQSQVFHEFADQRTFLGIPNFLNVVSNFPFILVGIAGVIFLYKEKRRVLRDVDGHMPFEHRPYLAVFISMILVFFGSAYYHWAPDSSTLFWDRLPIATGVMALLVAVWIERVPVKQVNLILSVAVLLGAASVVYWIWSEQQGAGNLNFYIVVQFGALLLIALLVIFFPSRYSRGTDIYGVLGWYTLAKFAEMLDGSIYQFGEIMSGHTLKHLLAGVAVYWLLRMLKRRRLQNESAYSGHQLYD